MELHQTLQKATEESLTLQHCKYFLSKTGEKESSVIYDGYCRKYHPKNGSLSYYFNHKLLQQSRMLSPKVGQSRRVSGEEGTFTPLPLLPKQKNVVMRDKWEKLIRMTEKENIVHKGCFFPRMISKHNMN